VGSARIGDLAGSVTAQSFLLGGGAVGWCVRLHRFPMKTAPALPKIFLVLAVSLR
jgi:hypothetical protein